MGVFKHNDIALHLLRHDCFKIVSPKGIIYIDPFGLPADNQKADVVLISHSHYDHLSQEDLSRVLSKDTVCICSPDAQEVIKKSGGQRIYPMRPGEKRELGGTVVETIPAYNINKDFHPKKNNWLGFKITIEGISILFAGDTDATEELKNSRCDIALLPVSGTYVMTAEEAAEVAKIIKPRIAAIPMHFGAVVGSIEDARRFATLAHGEYIAHVLEPDITD